MGANARTAQDAPDPDANVERQAIEEFLEEGLNDILEEDAEGAPLVAAPDDPIDGHDLDERLDHTADSDVLAGVDNPEPVDDNAEEIADAFTRMGDELEANDLRDAVDASGVDAVSADEDAAAETSVPATNANYEPDPVEALIGGENMAAAAEAEYATDANLSQAELDRALRESAEDEADAAVEPERADGALADSVDAGEDPAANADVSLETAESPTLEPVEGIADAPPVPAPEPATTTKKKTKRRAFYPVAFILAPIRRHPARAVASIAAGLAVGAGTFLYLFMNPARSLPPSHAQALGKPAELRRALRLAEEHMARADYGAAAAILTKAIDGAPATTERFDAEFLLAEAKTRDLPAQVGDSQANPLHARLDALLQQAPRHPRAAEALLWKGRLYEATDNEVAARTLYREALTLHPGSDTRNVALYRLGVLELDAGRPVQAGERFQTLIDEFPASPHAGDARLRLADALAADGDKDRARAAYIEIAQAAPDTELGARAVERLADLAAEEGDHAKTIEILERRLETATTISGNDRVYLKLARAYRAAGDFEQARTLLNELLNFFPESEITADAHVELAEVLNDAGQTREALRVAGQTVQRYPDHAPALRLEGRLLDQTGDLRGAGRAMLAADEAGADDPQLLLSAGRNLRRADETDRAREAFERLQTKFPKSAEAFDAAIESARLLYEEGQISAALGQLEDMRQTAAAPADRARVTAALAELYGDMGVAGTARSLYSDVAGATNDPTLLANAAAALLESEDWDEGLKIAQRVELHRVAPASAYGLLLKEGKVLLRYEPEAGLDALESAYIAFPQERTAAGDRLFLEAALAMDQTARARGIVMDIKGRVEQNKMDPQRLGEAAVLWGDHLYERGDYRAAADAYALALTGDAPDGRKSETQQWAQYQRANALYESRQFAESLADYEAVGQSNSPWAEEAAAQAEAARLALRLRGAPAEPLIAESSS